MPTETVTITAAAGHTLSGSLELPTGLVRGAALFAVVPHLYCGNATVPGWELVPMLFAVAIFGVLTTFVAVRKILRAPILSALRGD